MRITFGEDRIEGLVRQLGHGVDRPRPDPRRQRQQRAAMGHVGEAKPAIAIGIERIASRQEAIVDGDHRSWPYSAAAALPSGTLTVSEPRRPI